MAQAPRFFRRFQRFFSETGIGGGSKRTERLEGGELAPKVVLGKLGLATPKLRIFCRISVERGQIQGHPKIENFHPPSNFRRFDPPLSPVSNPRGPNDQKNLISIEIFNLDRNF